MRPSIIRADLMLRDLLPIPVDDMIQQQGSGCSLLFGYAPLRNFLFSLFYLFSIPAVRAFCGTVKSLSSDLKRVLKEWLFRVFVDRHDDYSFLNGLSVSVAAVALQ